MKPKEGRPIKAGKRSMRAGLLGVGMVIAMAAPAMAVDNVECNFIGLNCRGLWDHGTSSTTVWSNYKQLDVNHGSSVFGTRRDGVRQMGDSGCTAGPQTWSRASLGGVTNSRQTYYRNC